MSSLWDEIYSAYMTGAEGQGFAMFVFADGLLTGADPLGEVFEGNYSEDVDGNLTGTIRVKVPPDGEVIQGVSVGPSGFVYEVPITLSNGVMDQPFFQISTPLGAVNVKLEKLR